MSDFKKQQLYNSIFNCYITVRCLILYNSYITVYNGYIYCYITVIYTVI